MRADLALIGFGNVGRQLRTAPRPTPGLAGPRLRSRVPHRRHRDQTSWMDVRRRGPGCGAGGHRSWSPLRIAASAERPPKARRPMEASTSSGRLGRSTADLKVVIETTTLDVAAGQPAIDYVRAGLQAGCDVVTANKGPVVVRLRGTRCAGHGSRPVVPIRRRGHGRRAGLQSGAGDDAGGADPRVSRGHQQHHESRPDRDRAWRGFRQRGRAHAGSWASRRPTRRSISKAGMPRPRPRRLRTC